MNLFLAHMHPTCVMLQYQQNLTVQLLHVYNITEYWYRYFRDLHINVHFKRVLIVEIEKSNVDLYFVDSMCYVCNSFPQLRVEKNEYWRFGLC